MIDPKQKALSLCQVIAMTTFGDKEFNEGSTLPLHVVKKIAGICVDEILATSASEYEHEDNFWRTVKDAISSL